MFQDRPPPCALDDLDATSAFISDPLQGDEQVYMTTMTVILFLLVIASMLARASTDHATGAISAARDLRRQASRPVLHYVYNPCVLPMTVDADLTSLPLPDVSDKDIVASYAKLVDELLYICMNTVPVHDQSY